jgi:hypothetical protein
LASAFITVAEGATSEVAAAAVELISDDVAQSCEIGLNILRAVPAPKALDLLWSLNVQRNAALIAAKGDSGRWSERRIEKEKSFAALSCAARQAPHWLRAKALSVETAEEADQVIWLLVELDIHIAQPIWLEAKSNLLTRVRPNAIAVPRAIRHFRDRDELQRLESALEHPEPYGAALCFDALAYLAPDKALDSLARLTMSDLWGTSHWWLQGLCHRIGQAVHATLMRMSERGHEAGTGPRDLAILYSGQQDLLDPVTFDYLIDRFEACLDGEEKGEPEQPGARRHLRALIASVSSPSLLERLAACKGSRFERLVTRKAIAREGRASRVRDRDGMEYHLILGAIGGEGYDSLVLAQLDRPNPHARSDGIVAALWTPNAAVKAKLEVIAQSPNDDTVHQVHLMHALAAHRADSGLRAMVRSGASVFLRAVDIRDDGPLWTTKDLAEVKQLLGSDLAGERLQGINLCAFLGSEAAGSMLAPILEGSSSTDEEVNLARGVLSYLGYYQPTFLPRLRIQMGRDEAGSSTANYLAWNGDADARAVVVEWLAAHSLTELKSSELEIPFGLLQHPDSVAGALSFLRRLWKKGLGFGREGQILTVLAEAGDSEASAAL